MPPSIRQPATALIVYATIFSGFVAFPASAQPKPADGVLVGPNGMTLYTFDKDSMAVANRSAMASAPPTGRR